MIEIGIDSFATAIAPPSSGVDIQPDHLLGNLLALCFAAGGAHLQILDRSRIVACLGGLEESKERTVRRLAAEWIGGTGRGVGRGRGGRKDLGRRRSSAERRQGAQREYERR